MYTYVIYSEGCDRFYKGITQDLKDRMPRHNRGDEISTKSCVPWVLIWSAQKETRSEARLFERKLKNLSRLRLIKLMLDYPEGIAGPDAFFYFKILLFNTCYPSLSIYITYGDRKFAPYFEYNLVKVLMRINFLHKNF